MYFVFFPSRLSPSVSPTAPEEVRRPRRRRRRSPGVNNGRPRLVYIICVIYIYTLYCVRVRVYECVFFSRRAGNFFLLRRFLLLPLSYIVGVGFENNNNINSIGIRRVSTPHYTYDCTVHHGTAPSASPRGRATTDVIITITIITTHALYVRIYRRLVKLNYESIHCDRCCSDRFRFLFVIILL